jgi:nitroreductase
MNVLDAVVSRKSIRGFKPDSISKEVICEILKTSVRAPSSDNSQPWEIYVLAGEPLDNIRKDNVEALKNGVAGKAYSPYEPIYRKRQVDLAVQLFQLMDIAREDKEKRFDWIQRGFRFFDAPVGIILTADQSLDLQTAASDVGGLAQTIALVAMEYDLGTCISAQGITYPEIVRKHARIPKSKHLLLALALGYPDSGFPANGVKSEREPLSVNTSWMGFE